MVCIKQVENSLSDQALVTQSKAISKLIEINHTIVGLACGDQVEMVV
jgi:hypothetical protein